MRAGREKGPSSGLSGSHNIVLGHGNNHTSFGGIVGPHDSMISAPFASVSGGTRHSAQGNWSSVSGGYNNTASGHWSSVSGGRGRAANETDDWAAGHYSSGG